MKTIFALFFSMFISCYSFAQSSGWSDWKSCIGNKCIGSLTYEYKYVDYSGDGEVWFVLLNFKNGFDEMITFDYLITYDGAQVEKSSETLEPGRITKNWVNSRGSIRHRGGTLSVNIIDVRFGENKYGPPWTCDPTTKKYYFKGKEVSGNKTGESGNQKKDASAENDKSGETSANNSEGKEETKKVQGISIIEARNDQAKYFRDHDLGNEKITDIWGTRYFFFVKQERGKPHVSFSNIFKVKPDVNQISPAEIKDNYKFSLKPHYSWLYGPFKSEQEANKTKEDIEKRTKQYYWNVEPEHHYNNDEAISNRTKRRN